MNKMNRYRSKIASILAASALLIAVSCDYAPDTSSGSDALDRAVTISKPFPQAATFAGCIKPSNVTQADMDSAIKTFYDSYKSKYLKQCPDQTDQYYMYAEGNPSSSSDATCSEQHGYAMITEVLMAGYDANAKTYFDGMYKLYKRFPSSQNSNLMSWIITKSGSTMKGGSDSATDGDMDIAYSLILAHYQWGGGPEGTSVTYLNEAKRIINALNDSPGDISPTTYRTLVGDWAEDQYGTRDSDWMADHMRAYKNVTGDSYWTNVENEVFNCITDLTGPGKPGATTGLLPDFAKNDPAVADSAGAGTGEENAQYYSWNGCRVPWRLAMAYQHYGMTQAKSAVTKLMDWATVTPTSGTAGQFNGDPQKFCSGYKINGTKISGASAGELAFVAPIVLAATVDSKYQAFLNKGWPELSSLSGGDSYNDAIALLCMLAISGNWWIPGDSTPVQQYTISASAGSNGSISPSGSVVVNQGSNQTFTITPNSGYTVDAVTVDGVNQGAITSYPFSNVTANHTISATFKVTTVTQYTITAGAGSNGSISPSGSVVVNQGSNQTFTITPNSGYVVSAVTVDGTSQGAIPSYTFNNVVANHTISAAFVVQSSSSNIAPSGTGYVWKNNTSATSNSNKSAKTGINNNNLTTNVAISSGDSANRWEAAGVTFSAAKTVSSVKYYAGSVTSGGDGYFEANAKLQFSTDGTTWTDSGWSVSPAFAYTSSDADKIFVFSGSQVSGIKGVRIVGQVRVNDGSYFAQVKEVQVYGQ